MTTAHQPKHPMHPRARVLLLVADQKERERVVAVLRQDGHDVLAAASGQDAAVLLGSRMRRPAVAVVDMRMPASDGTAFATAYRRAPAPHPPIVLVSAPGAAVAAASATAATTGASVDPAYSPAALALIRSRVRLIAQEAPLPYVRTRTRTRSLLAAAALAAVLGIGALTAFVPAGSAAPPPPAAPAPSVPAAKGMNMKHVDVKGMETSSIQVDATGRVLFSSATLTVPPPPGWPASPPPWGGRRP